MCLHYVFVIFLTPFCFEFVFRLTSARLHHYIRYTANLKSRRETPILAQNVLAFMGRNARGTLEERVTSLKTSAWDANNNGDSLQNVMTKLSDIVSY